MTEPIPEDPFWVAEELRELASSREPKNRALAVIANKETKTFRLATGAHVVCKLQRQEEKLDFDTATAMWLIRGIAWSFNRDGAFFVKRISRDVAKIGLRGKVARGFRLTFINGVSAVHTRQDESPESQQDWHSALQDCPLASVLLKDALEDAIFDDTM